MRVAIMQPTYLPWAGYFGLMHSVDLFILLDTVQFARRSWQQRNQIKSPSGAKWLTASVQKRGRREQLISQVELDNSGDFVDVHRKTIIHCYSKAKYFENYASDFFAQICQPKEMLSDLNTSTIEYLASQLNISTQIRRASDIGGVGNKADLLADICKIVGATQYISVPGSKGYLDGSSAFEECGIPVRYFHFDHPLYKQLHGEFLPYMSVMDMLFNCGSESYDLIKHSSAVR